MNTLRNVWNRFSIGAFNLLLYDVFSMVGGVLLVCAVGFTLNPAKNMGAVWLCILWFAAAVTIGISCGKRYMRRKICKNGIKIKGEVTGVRRSVAKVHTSTMHYADEDAVHPFAIQYRYNFKGKEYTGTSEYFWSCPHLEPGSAVTLFVDEKHPARSACDESGFSLTE